MSIVFNFRNEFEGRLPDIIKQDSVMVRLKAEYTRRLQKRVGALSKRLAAKLRNEQHQKFLKACRRGGVPIMPTETRRFIYEQAKSSDDV